jgi:site-specific DNA-methyltransferase (adenine-specific)
MIDPVLIYGDAIEEMNRLPAESVAAVATDPPYGLSEEPDIREVLTHWIAGDRYEHRSAGFMGKGWDSFVPGPEYWRAARRVLKPGGMLLAFSSSRTSDLLSIAIRMAGFEIRDSIYWLHGQGFPKNLDISKALDKAANAERAVTGIDPTRIRRDNRPATVYHTRIGEDGMLTAPATEAARQWDGWGTALKPACEPIIVARAPLAESTVAANVLRYGTGGINIAACRVPGSPYGGL